MRMMNNLAAAVALCLIAAPVAAQQRDSAAAPAKAAADSAVPVQATHTQILAVIDSQETRLEKLAELNELKPESVKLVDVSALFSGENGPQLDSLVTRKAEAIAQLRATLESNTVVAPLFEAQQIKAANVVAMKVDQENRVWVFYRK